MHKVMIMRFVLCFCLPPPVQCDVLHTNRINFFTTLHIHLLLHKVQNATRPEVKQPFKALCMTPTIIYSYVDACCPPVLKTDKKKA